MTQAMQTRYRTSELYVVVSQHTDRYAFDTVAPEEVFVDCADAEALAQELSKSIDGSKWYVVPLSDRICDIKDAVRDQSYATCT